VKINLGCGDRPLKDHVNVDLYFDQADVKADIRQIGFPPGTAELVTMFHVIEHISRKEAVKLCGDIFDWLSPGGRLIIETPDRAKCIDLIERQVKHRDGRGVLRLIGAVGLCGGRPKDVDQQRYHNWLTVNREWLLAEAREQGHFPPVLIPDEFVAPGANHEYVWEENELAKELIWFGFAVRSEMPKTHGKRDWRDMRLVATKPEDA
jgi:SAM-dependent methyltransferase